MITDYRFFAVADLMGVKTADVEAIYARVKKFARSNEVAQNTLLAFQQIWLKGGVDKYEWLQVAEGLPIRLAMIAEFLGHNAEWYRDALELGADGMSFTSAVIGTLSLGE